MRLQSPFFPTMILYSWMAASSMATPQAAGFTLFMPASISFGTVKDEPRSYWTRARRQPPSDSYTSYDDADNLAFGTDPPLNKSHWNRTFIGFVRQSASSHTNPVFLYWERWWWWWHRKQPFCSTVANASESICSWGYQIESAKNEPQYYFGTSGIFGSTFWSWLDNPSGWQGLVGKLLSPLSHT